MANFMYPNAIGDAYMSPEQKQAILNSGLNNAMIMAGINMLGAPRTPYRQTFGENLAGGAGAGFGAFNQTVAGAQEQAFKNEQFKMQKLLNDLITKEKEYDLGRPERAKKLMGTRIGQPSWQSTGDLTEGTAERTRVEAPTLSESLGAFAPLFEAELAEKGGVGSALSTLLKAQETKEWKPTTREEAFALKGAGKEKKYAPETREEMLEDLKERERIKNTYDKGASRDARKDKREEEKLKRDRVNGYNAELGKIKSWVAREEVKARGVNDNSIKNAKLKSIYDYAQSAYDDLADKYPDLYNIGKKANKDNSGKNNNEQLIKAANDAVARGADPKKVRERLNQLGVK